MAKLATKLPANDAEAEFVQRCRADPGWGAAEIQKLRRLLVLITQQVDNPDNDLRTLKTFRGGTLMERARAIVKDLEAETPKRD